jgi:hypothetical protein
MAEPGNIPPVPPAPPGGAPFNPTAPAARPGPGCSKPLLIGCGAFGLLIGIAVIFFFYTVGKNPGRVINWTLTQAEKELNPRIPQDVTVEERERLKVAFADVRRKVAAGELSLEQTQALNYKILEISRKADGLKRQDVLELIALLEGLAGRTTEVANPDASTGTEPAAQAP